MVNQLQPAVFVPESLMGMELLQQFKVSGVQLAFIVDEYGEVQGIVTLQDVMEVVTGEFKTHRAEDAWAVQREDGSWLLDGLIPIPELKDRPQLDEEPEEEKGRYNTLSGMVGSCYQETFLRQVTAVNGRTGSSRSWISMGCESTRYWRH